MLVHVVGLYTGEGLIFRGLRYGSEKINMCFVLFMQLTECVLLNEIEMSVLMICGIKAGDARKIKAICKDMPCQSAKTKLSKESVKEV